jgi:colicin import membrane protein
MTMKTAAAFGAPYRVPKDEKNWRSMGLAVAMHALLLLFLWVGVRWQNNEPVAVEAEVWDMTTQSAAPPPPPPEPQPEPQPEPTPAPPPKPVAAPVEAPPPAKEPDIALEKRKAKEKAEKERQAEEKKAKLKQEEEDKKLADKKAKEVEQKKLEEKKAAEEKAKEDQAKEEKKQAEKAKAEAKAKADAEQKKLDKQREAEMRRITGAAGTGSTGTAAKATAPRLDSGYVAAITAKIKSNIAYTGGDTAGNPRAEFKIEQLPTGEIISVRKIKSSGIPAYDLAVENAIAKSSPLPKKKDGTVEREVFAGFNMKDLP